MIHNDHLGTPQKMTDASGTVVWAADYKPFGETTITVSTITNNLRFPGQYFDQETGLHYNYFRDYNPVIGRYIERDPIGLRGGINLYSYAGNDALNYIDPYGLVKGIHYDYTVDGERLMHYGKYRYNSKGDLVTHRGQVIEDVPRDAARTLEWLRRMKPNYFEKPGGTCGSAPGLKGPKGGGTLLGIISFLPLILDAYDVQQQAERTGVDFWTLMNYRMQGIEVVEYY